VKEKKEETVNLPTRKTKITKNYKYTTIIETWHKWLPNMWPAPLEWSPHQREQKDRER